LRRLRIRETSAPATCEGVSFPATLRCESSDVDLDAIIDWIRSERPRLLQRLGRHGAICFRGFPIPDAEAFDRFLSSFGYDEYAFDHSLSNAVRRHRTPRVFTANEAPSSAIISLHHELAQTRDYPRVLFFFCEMPARRGGATMLCRSDTLYAALAARCPAFVERLAEAGLRYTTVMPEAEDPASGQGRSWRSTFGGRDQADTERILDDLGYRWTWLPGGALRATTPVLPAIRETAAGRPALFNQLIAAHVGWRGGDGQGPAPVEHGDGAPLDPEAVEVLIALATEQAVDLEWRRGDVALLDNHSVMHGRRDFEGPRSVLAAFGRDRR